MSWIWIALIVLAARLWGQQVMAHLRGKRFAVLGERKVGKSALIEFLREGTIPSEYRQTTSPLPYKGSWRMLGDLELSLKKGYDIGGGERQTVQWHDLFREAEVVLYLFNADRLRRGDSETEARVIEDLEQINGWLHEHKKPVILVGTHADLDPEFRGSGTYYDDILGLPVVQEMLDLASSGRKIVVGSLASVDSAAQLAYGILNSVCALAER